MIGIKEGVNLLGLAPQTAIGFMVCSSVYDSYGENCTMTSGTEGKHGPHTQHKKGCAFDLRTRDVKTDLHLLVDVLQTKLSSQFQVVLEKDHIHVEFDPY